MKHPFLIGNRIYLRGLEEADIDGPYFQWFNDAEVCEQNSHHRFPNSKQKMKSYFEHVSVSQKDLVLAVVTKDTDLHIGNVSLQSMDFISRSAELAIIIGEKDFWGKGYAFEACQLILQHGFDQFGFHRIYCATPKDNKGMRKLAQKLGMKQEGIARESFFKNGKFQDGYQFGVLRHEFKL